MIFLYRFVRTKASVWFDDETAQLTAHPTDDQVVANSVCANAANLLWHTMHMCENFVVSVFAKLMCMEYSISLIHKIPFALQKTSYIADIRMTSLDIVRMGKLLITC